MMQVHDACKIFPDMSRDEFQALCDDIAKRGQLDPIVTHDNMIIDGRHRYQACCLLGIVPRFEAWSGQGGSLLEFVVSRNLHRRNLSVSQRADIATDIKKRLEVEGIERMREAGKKSAPGKPAEKGLANLPNL